MYIVKQTPEFSKWLKNLKDKRAQAKIGVRLVSMKNGNLGDHKSVGEKVSELRITTGKGYRVYYTKRGNEIIILLIGGDKSTQQKDIRTAQKMVKDL